MAKESLHLWYANPEYVLPEAISEAYMSMLSDSERARWQALRSDSLRREYLVTRALVRTALSCERPVAPAAWRFELTDYGKPFIFPDCGLRFNLSNSPKLVVCLISQGTEVGVDAEPYDRAGTIADLGCDVFSSMELTQLQALCGTERLDRALSLWTLKEAYIKARGMGITLDLTKVSFLYGEPEGIRLVLDSALDDKAESWRFCLLEHAGHRIAVMVQGDAKHTLQVSEMRSLPAITGRLAHAPEQWYPLQ